MAKKKIPLGFYIGKRFNRLVVLGEHMADGSSHRIRMFHVLCDCGVEKYMWSGNVLRGSAKSCGCLHREKAADKCKTYGLSWHPLYVTWYQMVDRCTRSRRPDWHRYGGRGISVCAEWQNDPQAFFDYIGERPKGASLDRIDNNGNYEPGNVRWADRITQGSNTRINHFVEFNGSRLTLAELSRRTGINASTLWYRERKGLPLTG